MPNALHFLLLYTKIQKKYWTERDKILANNLDWVQ